MTKNSMFVVTIRPGQSVTDELEASIVTAGEAHGLTPQPAPPRASFGFGEELNLIAMALSGAGGVATGVIANTLYDRLKALGHRTLAKGRASDRVIEFHDPETGLRVTVTKADDGTASE